MDPENQKISANITPNRPGFLNLFLSPVLFCVDVQWLRLGVVDSVVLTYGLTPICLVLGIISNIGVISEKRGTKKTKRRKNIEVMMRVLSGCNQTKRFFNII